MRIFLPVCRVALLCLCVSLFALSFCYANDKLVEVVGVGECADCKENNVRIIHAVSGLRVTVDCKTANGELRTRGEGELDKEGKFRVTLANEIIKDGTMQEECFVQLHSAASTPCPADNLELSKVIFKTKEKGKHTLGPAGKLKFSSTTCASAFLWPHYKHKPLHKLPPFHKSPHPKFPKSFPPIKNFDHTYPKYPKFKKPYPPPVPKLHPKLPGYEPLPPIPKYPKKPCPPLTVPPFHPNPTPFPKIHPKVFKHPKFGYWPPLTPFPSHP